MLIRYAPLDGFNQPPEIPQAFTHFVQSKVAAGPRLERTADAIAYSDPTPTGARIPATLYPNTAAGEVTARYLEDGIPPLPSLQLRTFKDGTQTGSTNLYSDYIVYPDETDGLLLIAKEVNGERLANGDEAPSNPQALAAALGRASFERGRVTQVAAADRMPIVWGLVGPEEFAALGRFLVGRELT